MIEVERLETGVFIYHWSDIVTMEEAQQAVDEVKSLVDGSPFVAIIDMTRLSRLPNDIRKMRQNIKADIALGLQGYVVYGASRVVETLIRPLSALAPTRYAFAASLDEARAAAHALLAESRSVSGEPDATP